MNIYSQEMLKDELYLTKCLAGFIAKASSNERARTDSVADH